jgi:hypothetical protein
MAIGIDVTGLTAQQADAVKDAFDATINGRTESGLTKAQWVERCLLRHIKAVVKGWKRQQHETVLHGEQQQVEIDFPEA